MKKIRYILIKIKQNSQRGSIAKKDFIFDDARIFADAFINKAGVEGNKGKPSLGVRFMGYLKGYDGEQLERFYK